MRTSFLHLADTRLGYRDAADPQATFNLTAQQFRFAVDFALDQRASFVLFSGNLFDAPDVEPEIFQVALRGLSRLAEKNVDCIAIRGQRDLVIRPDAMTWYDVLAQEGLLATLEVGAVADSQLELARWDRRACAGGYFDLTRCRVFGLHYYGAMSSQLLPALSRAANAIDNREMDFRILLLHGRLEHFSQAAGSTLSYSDLLLLRRQIDYVALGGCEQAYETEGWVYNPGPSGFYHVTVDTAVQPKHTARYVAYPSSLAAARPSPKLIRPQRQTIEEAIFDELAAGGQGAETERVQRRDVVRLVTQSMWGLADAAVLHRQLVEVAGAELEHVDAA